MNKDDKTRIGATLYAAYIKTFGINQALEAIDAAKKVNIREHPGAWMNAVVTSEITLKDLNHTLNRIIDLHANDAGFDPRNKKEN